MLQNLQNFAKFQNFQLDNLVDFEKCCKTRIYLQRSVPIQPKTSNICRNVDKMLARDERLRGSSSARPGARTPPRRPASSGATAFRTSEGTRRLAIADTNVPIVLQILQSLIFSDFCQILEGSFSVVSTTMFATKY